MFSLFHKKSGGNETPLKKEIQNLKCRKISFVYTDFDELCENMKSDINAVLNLKPVNYYAEKNRYIMGNVYTNEDFSKNYIQFFKIESERQCGKSEIYPIDSEILSKILAKVGIIITLPQK